MLVTGREGQVARSLAERAPASEWTLTLLGRPELDLEWEPAAIETAIARVNPDIIVSAAAFTAVDVAESEPDRAMAVNARGAGAVAAAADRLGVPIIHVSTDYVFAGYKASPYVEDDEPDPIGAYGRSKRAGEQAVLAATSNAVILRTAWVYSPFGHNFVKAMLRLAADRAEIDVVADQFGNPTSALDLADAILQIAGNLTRSTGPELRGLFHLTAAGDTSWADFARRIFEESAKRGGPAATVNSIASTDYPTPARRPANSRLDSGRIGAVHGVRLPPWQESIGDVVERILSDGRKGGSER
jgi:dTDP-4-dehydrorhamnose reductase